MGRYIPTQGSWPNSNVYQRGRKPAFNYYSRLSFAKEYCLRIQRGGANRFVNDDGNEHSSNNRSVNKNSNNNDGKAGARSRNRMRLGEKGATKGLRKHSPVVYQYFGKSRSRGGQSFQSQSDESPLNFILLGPNVDHWKTIGQTLASRGFNVMACERMAENQQGNDVGEGETTNYEDAPDLVLEILGAYIDWCECYGW